MTQWQRFQKCCHTLLSILKQYWLLVFVFLAIGATWPIEAMKMYYVLSLAENDFIVVSIIGDPNEPNRRGIYDKYQLNGSQKDALVSILRRDTSVGGRSLAHAEIAFCQVRLLDSKSVCVGKISVYGRGSREIELTNVVRSGIPVSDYPPSSPSEYAVGRRLRQ